MYFMSEILIAALFALIITAVPVTTIYCLIIQTPNPIIVYTLIIFYVIYSILGFIYYGLKLAEIKYNDEKEMLRLGLSKEALKFKPQSKKISFKIFLFITSLFFIIIIFNISMGTSYDNITFKYGFKIW